QEVVHRLRVRVRADRVAVEVVPGRVDDARQVVEGRPRGGVVLDRRAEGPVTRRTDAQPETRQGEARPDSARLGRVRRHGLARLRVPDQAAGLAVVQPVTVRVDRLGHVAHADRVADLDPPELPAPGVRAELEGREVADVLHLVLEGAPGEVHVPHRAL